MVLEIYCLGVAFTLGFWTAPISISPYEYRPKGLVLVACAILWSLLWPLYWPLMGIGHLIFSRD